MVVGGTKRGCLLLCDHSKSSYANIGGVVDANGQVLSRQTAEYPSELAEQFAAITLPLFSTHARDIQWDNRSEVIPIKGLIDPPKSLQDGGGVHSIPDWNTRIQNLTSFYRSEDLAWMQHIMNNKWHLRTLAHMEQRFNTPIFSDDEVSQFRKSLDELAEAHGYCMDWSIPPDQPINLHALKILSSICKDSHTTLCNHLIAGVPTGCHNDIPISDCFPTTTEDDAPHNPLSVHLASWESALDDPAITSLLVQDEIDNNWVDKFSGDVAAAQFFFNGDISVERLGVAISDSRPPRLRGPISGRTQSKLHHS